MARRVPALRFTGRAPDLSWMEAFCLQRSMTAPDDSVRSWPSRLTSEMLRGRSLASATSAPASMTGAMRLA